MLEDLQAARSLVCHPCRQKFFARMAVGDIILELFRSLDLHYPPAESPEILAEARELLVKE